MRKLMVEHLAYDAHGFGIAGRYQPARASTNWPNVLAGLPCQFAPWSVLASNTALIR